MSARSFHKHLADKMSASLVDQYLQEAGRTNPDESVYTGKDGEVRVRMPTKPLDVNGVRRWTLNKLFYHHRGQLKFGPVSIEYQRKLVQWLRAIKHKSLLDMELIHYHGEVASRRATPSRSASIKFTEGLRKELKEWYPDWEEVPV